MKRSGHRPDLVAYLSDLPAAIEVELAAKSKARLRAILQLHAEWAMTGKTTGVIYVCGNQEARGRIQRAADRLGLIAGKHIRIELLDDVISHTRRAFDARKSADRARSSPTLWISAGPGSTSAELR